MRIRKAHDFRHIFVSVCYDSAMLATVLTLAMMQKVELQPFEKGSWLYHACKGAVRWMDAPDTRKPSEEDENFANCTSYFFGYTDGLPFRSICLGDATVGTSIRVYIAYMDRNPKLMDSARFVGMDFALRESYPCPAKPK